MLISARQLLRHLSAPADNRRIVNLQGVLLQHRTLHVHWQRQPDSHAAYCVQFLLCDALAAGHTWAQVVTGAFALHAPAEPGGGTRRPPGAGT